MLQTHSGGPLLLRFSDSSAAAVAAGLWAPWHAAELTANVSRLIGVAPDPVWIAGYDARRTHPWGERAQAMVHLAQRHGFWGRLPAGWAAASPQAESVAPWATERECPVCFDDFSDDLPTPDGLSRAPPGRWACAVHLHTVCRACDAHIQGSANARCPLCRADRLVHMLP